MNDEFSAKIPHVNLPDLIAQQAVIQNHLLLSRLRDEKETAQGIITVLQSRNRELAKKLVTILDAVTATASELLDQPQLSGIKAWLQKTQEDRKLKEDAAKAAADEAARNEELRLQKQAAYEKVLEKLTEEEKQILGLEDE